MQEERHTYTNGEKVLFYIDDKYRVLVIQNEYRDCWGTVDEMKIPARAVLDLFDFLSAHIEKFRKSARS